MEPSVLAGDYIIVNKLAYGARIIKNFNFMKGGKFETFRVKGFGKVKRNDVIVFNFPYSDWNKLQPDLGVFYLKRCVAIPGDTFYIENGIYKVKQYPDTLGFYQRELQLSQMPDSAFNEGVFNCFPDKEHYGWTIKNFGPLHVPKIGDNLAVDTLNILIYKHLIEYETDQRVEINEGKVYLDSVVLNNYTFKMNYYFMAGDFIFDSRDSRYWGLLPEDHIVGKASLIWQSKDMNTGNRRWNRICKTIK
ncbi:signal peptidase I [Bacteroidia bacterium]|nr:signal peptidase I [Bacteroidia bacterium]